MLVVVFATAAVAHVTRRMVPFVLATIPLVISILLVNIFIYPGATDVIADVGPFKATWTGLTEALQATLRVVRSRCPSRSSRSPRTRTIC